MSWPIMASTVTTLMVFSLFDLARNSWSIYEISANNNDCCFISIPFDGLDIYPNTGSFLGRFRPKRTNTTPPNFIKIFLKCSNSTDTVDIFSRFINFGILCGLFFC